MKQYEGFKGDAWIDNINVKQFILDNYTEYTGDESFLEGVTEKTKRLRKSMEKLAKKERRGQPRL